jgi:3-oxoacyl-[acyl-carrier protein] reductase
MDLGLTGKVALVTGASRGIGRAIAVELAREGCDVLATARDGDRLGALAREVAAMGRRCEALVADLREPEAAAQAAGKALSGFGRLDLLVCNAGATKRGDFFRLTDEDFLDGFALKFHAHVRLVRGCWPLLRAAQGRVIHVIGAGGRTASADFTIGGAVNAALYNFVKAMAQVGKADGVRVLGVNPGSIETDRLKGRIAAIMKEERIDEAEARRRELAKGGATRFGQPEEIGRLIAFLASDRAGYVNGALVDCDGGVTRAI